MAHPGRVFSRRMLLEALWGTRRLPRPAHDRRPRPAPAREDRGRLAPARARSSPCAASATGSATREPAPQRRRQARARAARRRRRVRSGSSTSSSCRRTSSSLVDARLSRPRHEPAADHRGRRCRSTSSPQWVEEEAAPLVDARVVVFQRRAASSIAVPTRARPAAASGATSRRRLAQSASRAVRCARAAAVAVHGDGTVTRNGRAVCRGRVPASRRSSS